MLDNYGIRTDLALEATERFTEENVEVRGVEIHEDYNEEKDIRTTVVKITTENGARTMGRPQGSYITIEAPGLSVHDEDYHREISLEIARHLQNVINSGSRSGKFSDHSRFPGASCGRKSSYNETYDKRVWPAESWKRKNAPYQRNYPGSNGADRDGDI
jgi:hypothetical protein